MRLDAYVRVSQVKGRDRKDGGSRFISPAVQEKKAREWANLHEHEIVQVHRELDESGARADRPMLLEVLRRIESHEVDGVVVATLDRFGRSLIDSLQAIERIEEAGGTFVSVADSFDLQTDTGRLVLRMMLSLAQFELERVRTRFADARARAVLEQGIHISPVPPVGYKRGPDRRLLKEPDVAPIIEDVFRRRARGESWASLASYLEEEQVSRPYDASRSGEDAGRRTRWNSRSVKWVIDNPVYYGQARHGVYVKEGAHEPIVDAETWRRAQRDGKQISPARSEAKLLTGLLRCAGCRYAMRSFRVKTKTGEPGPWQWVCHQRHQVGRCPAPASIRGARAETVVEEHFFKALDDLSLEASQADEGELEELTREVEKTQRALAAFRDDPDVEDALGHASFVEGLRTRAARADEAEQALASHRATLDNRLDLDPVSVRSLWPKLGIEERRTLFHMVVESVFVRRGRGDPEDRIWVAPRGTDIEVPRRGVRLGRLLEPIDWS